METQTPAAQTTDRPPPMRSRWWVPPQLLKVQRTDQACAKCGQPIGPGWLYVVGPPVEHVSCPNR